MNAKKKLFRLEKRTGLGNVFWQIELTGKEETQITEGRCGSSQQSRCPPEVHTSSSAALRYINQQIRFRKRQGYQFHSPRVHSEDDLRYKLSKNRKARAEHVRDTVARLRGDLDSVMHSRDSDTDSVASSASSFQFNLEKRRAQQQKAPPPLNRRRSLRLELKMGDKASLQSQNTVGMKTIRQPPLQKMETPAVWKFREPAAALLKQDTEVLLAQGVPQLDSQSSSLDSSEHVSPIRRPLLRTVTTTTELRSVLQNTKLESIKMPETETTRLKRKRSVVNETSSSSSSSQPVRTRLKRKASVACDTSATSASVISIKKLKHDESLPSIYKPPKKLWPVTLNKAPVVLNIPLLDRVGAAKQGLAVHVDENRCVLGEEDGTVLAFDSKAEFRYMMKLPSGVKCFLPDGEFLYAGCSNGSIYDISHMIPQLACRVQNFGKVLGLALCSGSAAMSDEQGNIAVVDAMGKLQWKSKSSGQLGWMVCIDETGVYHGHSSGVTKYTHLSGAQSWQLKTDSPVLHGTQEGQFLYVASGSKILKCAKASGKIIKVYDKGSDVTGNVNCVAISRGLILAAGDKLVCYDEQTGDVIYNVQLSMKPEALQYFRGRLFCLGLGGLEVIEMTESTVINAMAGQEIAISTTTADVDALAVLPTKEVTSCSDITSCEAGKVLVECVAPSKNKRGILKAKALSLGFKANSVIKLPSELMEEGAKYVIDEVRSGGGDSYTAHGNIHKIVQSQPST